MKIFYLLTLTLLLSMCTSKKEVEVSAKIDRIEMFESQFVPARNIDIWLPMDYSSEKKYNVLYMHDGQMLYDSTTTWNKQSWNAGETMQNLINSQKVKKTMIGRYS